MNIHDETISKVFVSYSREDAAHMCWTRGLVQALRDCGGVEVIFDEKDLTAGDAIPEYVISGIGEADCIIMVFCTSYARKIVTIQRK
jgi:TIR domain